ncbi:lysophospholipid acyltransferase family protein [Salisediminibacterium halotolerans]|uniref:1-acyl-sn-glycerol-3-phosphate acyltransferase n=1 Tax=Salisediminibacterium halotolerans TaxID=517425 RepID=A0A1H9P4M5_9BACI|nr:MULTISPECIES: lysophospholipid acyltransferase family protein [Salisediminibacterium]RLJ77960.1 1-acyl-sn-glycerol-3-phosphate acyltransferase [Actinophytocola xinjiangensis]RPE88702.1 1-acyl-sn-glycerol-3-phosphate acyltransferase [Salisediminibacterium halotolerans]TWG36937.1 1-acyl-sn-glycerol-3-phosphate acyltransferase [Salisediminibacterium halotolerans]SER43138.1 1-acyl-sn-glycerol-3-phosphate acyltransferase [Salisediminibacterium haloalkalitolerans]GEL08102.1 1-acyl-sn-glycerol-3-p
MNKRLYHAGQFVCRMFFRLFYRVEIIGKENIPSDRGVLMCSNHINNLDPPLVGAFLKRETRFMAKAELFEAPVLKKLLPKLGAFPIRRGTSDRQAMRTGLGLLKERELVGVFPEGTRSKTGRLGDGLSGVGFFALRSEADVIPCAVIGSYKPFSRIKLIYGEPLNMQPLRENKASPEQSTKAIMSGIQALLDEHKTS